MKLLTSYKKCFNGLPLKFYGESDGQFEIFGWKIFNLHKPKVKPEMTSFIVDNRLFRTWTDSTACFSSVFRFYITRIPCWKAEVWKFIEVLKKVKSVELVFHKWYPTFRYWIWIWIKYQNGMLNMIFLFYELWVRLKLFCRRHEIEK